MKALSANPMRLPFRMDCRIKSGNDEEKNDDHERKRKRNAGKRGAKRPRHSGAARTADKCTRSAHTRSARVRSPAGVPPRLLGRRANASFRLRHALPGTRSPCPSPATWSQTGRNAGRAFSPKPPGAGHNPRPQAPHSLHDQVCLEITSLTERAAAVILIATAKSKRVQFLPMNQGVSHRAFWSKRAPFT
jgi:hypothetical protein